MAQTDTRPGFRLPWTAEHDSPSDQSQELTSESADSPSAEAPADGSSVVEQTTASEASTLPEEPETSDMIDATATSSSRKPTTKFMAELSRAMQTAVETSRDETMARLGADAKSVVEEINAHSAVEAAELRRRADDDVAAVREWSKAEIARIREETEARIALRKTALDGEMDQHGLVVESRVQQVGATVAEYEAQMDAFFERLRSEEDPTRIAAMAERMPDPPDLAAIAAAIVEPTTTAFDPSTMLIGDTPSIDGDGSDMTDEEETADTGETETGELETPEASAETGETEANGETYETAESSNESMPDFAAAEAEAATFTGDVEDDTSEPAPSPAAHDHESAAAALAATADDSPPQGERATTRVMVTGLVSVASIATFKRSLGRVPGVSTIGVASGPDGEFVFTVSHDSGIGLGDAIVALPGFEAQVTAEDSGGIAVTAHDPDAGS
jgi:hypothetical protein